MLRRAKGLVGRARERIRAAGEADPHGWNGRDEDRSSLRHDDEEPAPGSGPDAAPDGVPTGPTTSAGTRPAAACASSTRVSTRHQSSYLCSSLQTRPISGSV